MRIGPQRGFGVNNGTRRFSPVSDFKVAKVMSAIFWQPARPK